VVVVTAAVLTIAPWTIRNAVSLRRFVPVTTEDGYTLAGTYNDVARAQTRFPAAWVAWYTVPSNLAAIRNVPHTEVDEGDALRSRALTYARRHPDYVLKVAWWNARRVFDAAGLAWVRTDIGGYGLPESMGAVELVSFWLVAVLSLVGLTTGVVRRAPLWIWTVPLVMLAPVFTVGYLRFRAPIDPFIAIAAALGATAVWARASRARRRAAA
jgi:hypothetical protein